MKRRYCLALALLVVVCGSLAAEPVDLGFDLDEHLGTYWYGVYLGGKKSGYAVMRMEKISHEGHAAYKSSAEVALTLSMMGQTQTLQQKEYRIFYASGGFAECLSSLGPQSYRGVVTGDTMTITGVVGGAESEKKIPAPKVTLHDEVAPLKLVLGKPEVGDSVTVPGFDPMLGKQLTTVVEVTGRKTVLFRGVETTVYEIEVTIKEMNIVSPMLITESGDALKLSIPVGMLKLEMRLEDEASARDPSVETVEVLDASTIRPAGEIPKGFPKLVKLKLTGLKREDNLINDERQSYRKLQEGVYELTIVRDTLPEDPPDLPIGEAEVGEYLRSTELYQSDHPEIVSKAREIVGEARSSARASQILCLWVFTNVAKRGTVSYSNALETLRNMAGDCSEHTALFVGLCRAAGLPARVSNGLAYSSGLKAFGGHAWAEVYVGKWIAVDPTFGEPVASPVRIKLATDDLIEATKVLNVIGRVEIEFLPIDR